MENWRQQGTRHKMYAGWTEIKVVIWVYSIQCNVFIRQNQQYTPRCIIRRECIWSKPLQIWMKYFQTVFSGIRRSCFLKCCNHNEIAIRNKEAQCHEKVFKLSLCPAYVTAWYTGFHPTFVALFWWSYSECLLHCGPRTMLSKEVCPSVHLTLTIWRRNAQSE